MEERVISFKSGLYSTLKKWKLLLILFVVFFVVGYGFFWIRSRKVADASKNTTAANATNVADVIASEEVEKTKQHALEYKEYLENSEYMKIDPNALHQRIIYYVIKWTEPGLSGDAYENRSATLYGLLSAIFPSQELKQSIQNYNSEYAGRSLDELIDIGRSGNTIRFSIAYSDDGFVKDLEYIIANELSSKADFYKALIGDYEIVLAQEIDRAVDGTSLKDAQNTKKTNLTNLEKEISDLEKRADTSTFAGGGSGILIGGKNILICLAAGFFVALCVVFLIAVFGKKINTSTDISDQLMRDVLCIIKKEPEAGIDKMYYMKNDKYRNPERYLSILEKNMVDDGINRLWLYKCAETDLFEIEERVKKIMNNVEVVPVPEQEKERFYLDVKENEGVVILTKGGDTRRDELIRIEANLNAVGVKCLGEIFAV